MSLDFDPFARHLELRPVRAAREGAAPARVFVLLPTLAELLGAPAFGLAAPIVLPGHPRPLTGWALFGTVRERGITQH
jgi:hypothetical protein